MSALAESRHATLILGSARSPARVERNAASFAAWFGCSNRASADCDPNLPIDADIKV
jgi:hypothetical protein